MNILNGAAQWLVVLQCLVHLTGTAEVGYCSFPEFLWQAASGTINRKWYGRTEFFQNTEFWERHTEVLTKQTEISIREKVYAPCDRDIEPDETTVPCYREDIVMNFICIAEEPQGKYRLQQNIKGELTFSCIQFVKRNDNLIQIRKAPSESANEDWLCYDQHLVHDEWPWIDFHFQCWASWHEHDFTFVLFGEWSKTPRYVLRIPKHGDIYDEFKATLYLSPIAPVNPTGAPQSQVGYIDLELLRSEPGVCYDASRKCRQLMAEGKCTNSGLHQYANFCKKSCGLCPRSDLFDQSFDMCTFRDDPYPLGGLVRSSTYKLFLPMESMFLGSCGVGGEASVQLKLADGRECSGSVWDVNLNTCEASSHLSMQAPSCSSHTKLEFLCSAFLKLSSNTSFLVTMTSHEPQYICWVQTQRSSLVIVHDRVLCETAAKPVLPKHIGDIVSFTVFKDLEHKPCGKLIEEKPTEEEGAKTDSHNASPEAHVAPRMDAAVTPLDTDRTLYRSHQSDSRDYVQGHRKTAYKKVRSRKKHRHKDRNRTSTEYTGWEITRSDDVTVIPIQVALALKSMDATIYTPAESRQDVVSVSPF
ncbi:hypothetical protein CAPTEDRAFT_207027 [Capitella teleta]|uniref:ShKT domain-containing protein n=1 Tax=Capitella teleta TaxID=283909 RepID=R7UQY2_CAPTE|nr:hypothetical protein CAPTEDRAFT_207027 [Capitella teleta]|eukprot:ELU08949.1 hypothetical protein CAPTEDRAFT_207027 [Capitella teleta]